MALSSRLLFAIQKLAKNFKPNPGGLADGMSPKDFPQDQLAKGVEVESKEHGPEQGVATTMDHLVENEEYYDYLEVMEEQMKKDTSKLQSSIAKLKRVLAINEAPSVEKIQQWIDKYAVKNPAERRFDGDHIYILFSDGELCLTKAGPLFGQRNLHMQRGASPNKAPEGIKWPSSYGSHPCVYVEESQIAEALSNMIFEPPVVGSQEYEREEGLRKFFEAHPMREKKEPSQYDLAIQWGFEPFLKKGQKNLDSGWLKKGDVELFFDQGTSLKAIEISGEYYDPYWYSRITPSGIYLHPTGWFGFEPEKKALKEKVYELARSNVHKTSEEIGLELEKLGFKKIT